MKSEVEIRALVPEPKRAATALQRGGFALIDVFDQHDIIHDRPDGSLFRSGQKIRLRIEGDHAEFTYKGAFQGDATASRRAEINVVVNPSDVPALSEMLEALGYPMLFQVKKVRTVFRSGSVAATLDEWPIIGSMLELEGPEDEIKGVAQATFPEIEFGNSRLKTLFERVCAERGRTLDELQTDYEARSGFSLGNIRLLLN